MFTGIITAIGEITNVMPLGDTMSGIQLRIHAGELALDDVTLGDSIAIQGACMTVVQLTPPYFGVEVSQESLRLTKGLDVPGKVNLEKALRLSDRLGGHLVTGHIDGLGTVTEFRQVGESYLLKVLAPVNLAKYLAYKGSIVVNGVSLTINSIRDRGHAFAQLSQASKGQEEGCEVSINLIPHTLHHTTLQSLKIGQQVNLEIDLIARYVERMMTVMPNLQ